MATLNLDIEFDYDFQLIAISSNQRAYTLCWAINNMLKSSLSLADSHTMQAKNRIVQYRKYISNERGFYFTLLCNKSLNDRLLKELPTVDFLIKIHEEDSPYSESEIVLRLRKLKEIQAVYSLDVSILKSKQALIFD